jgi:hypothetical protein
MLGAALPEVDPVANVQIAETGEVLRFYTLNTPWTLPDFGCDFPPQFASEGTGSGGYDRGDKDLFT